MATVMCEMSRMHDHVLLWSLMTKPFQFSLPVSEMYEELSQWVSQWVEENMN